MSTTTSTPPSTSWSTYRHPRGTWYVRSSTGQFLATMATGSNRLDGEHARMMAAAPDLVQALETLNEWSITAADADFPYPVVEAALVRARGR